MSDLAVNEARFRALVTATSEVVYRMSPDWKVMDVLDGRGFLASTTKPTIDWKEKNVHPEDLLLVEETIQRAISAKSMFELEHRVLRADGNTGWTVSRAVPILNSDGEITEWFGAASDISLRKEAEHALQQAKEIAEQQKRMYETVISNTPDLIYVFGLDYRFTYANQALLAMWGKDWDSAVGKSLLENGYEPWHAEMHEREIDKIVATKKSIRGEVAFPHAVLGRRVYDYILTPVFNSLGEVVAVSGTTRDVTERKSQELENLNLSDELAAINEELAATNEELTATNEQLMGTRDLLGGAIEQLTRSENKLRYLIANAPVAIALLTGRGMIVDTANQKILEIWGKGKEVIGTPLIEGLPELVGQRFPQLLDDVFTSGEAYVGNEAYVLLEGREWYINFVYQPLKNEQGEVDSILVTATDVTELVLSRHKIEEAETALRLAIEAANFGTWWIHSETREFTTSPRLKELFGFSPSQSISIADAIGQITPEYRNYVAEKLEKAITSGGNYDVTYPVIGFHNKVLRWLRAVGNLKQDKSGEFSAFTGVVMDITEPYLAAKKIEQAEESLRLAIEAADLGSFALNVKDRTFTASGKLKSFFGFDPSHQVSFTDVINQIDEEYRQTVVDKVQEAIDKDLRFDMEYPVVGFSDGKVRWVRGIGTVRQENNGVDRYFTGVLNEITERKMDEIRKNDFIGMVSHELKTPLTSLNGYIQLMQRKATNAADDFMVTSLDSALKQVKKMLGMINGFLNISRLESGKIVLDRSHFDLQDLIGDVVGDWMQLDSAHQISYEGCGAIQVFADRDKIGNVLSNLISNAIKYSPSGTDVKVNCKVIEDRVQISVTDRGRGLRENDLEKIFERYYRVEDNTMISGFGIGLYLSAEIINRHQGKIWAESTWGEGSAFHFQIPISKS